MAFQTYDEARAALLTLNAEIEAMTAPSMSASADEHERYNAARRELRAKGEAAGFRRNFDNRFFLSPAQVALPKLG